MPGMDDDEPVPSERVMLLVHSPVLAPVTWHELRPHLEAAGWRVAVPDLRPLADASPMYPALCNAAAAAVPLNAAAVVVVGHSRAGPLLPGVAAAVGPAVSHVVFVDARLPHAGRSWQDTLSADRLAALENAASSGRLPTWDRWFPPEALAELLPDRQQRSRLVGDLPQLPWGLVTEAAPHAEGAWDSARHVYVQLSEAYEAVAAQADADGYQVLRARADHLAMMTRPSLVADLLLAALA
jgi:hypothetical protein